MLFIVAGVLASVPVLISACEGDMERDIIPVSTPDMAKSVTQMSQGTILAPTAIHMLDTTVVYTTTMPVPTPRKIVVIDNDTGGKYEMSVASDGTVIDTVVLEPTKCREIPTVEVEISYVLSPPSSLEDNILSSEIIARGMVLSAERNVKDMKVIHGGNYVGEFLDLHFKVIEYLKGSGPEVLTVEEFIFTTHSNCGRESARKIAEKRLADSKSRLSGLESWWEGREALIFIRPSVSYKASRSGASSYTFAGSLGFPEPIGKDDILRRLNYQSAWLPSISSNRASDGASSDGPRYRTQGTVLTLNSPLSMSLSEIKELITTMATHPQNNPRYEGCLWLKFYNDGMNKAGHKRPSQIDIQMDSGLPKGHVFNGFRNVVTGLEYFRDSDPNPPYSSFLVNEFEGWPPFSRSDLDSTDYYARLWVSGQDAGLFVSETVDDPDNDPSTGYTYQVVTARPIPSGIYKIFYFDQPASWVACGYNPMWIHDDIEYIITVTTSAEVLHEAFFDPEAFSDPTDNGGVAVGFYDDSFGVLKPPLIKGTSTSIQSLLWENKQVKMSTSESIDLSDYVMDFINLEGEAFLTLGFDDAASESYLGIERRVWNVPEQPWQSGDLLMIRIRERDSKDDSDAVAQSNPNVPTITPTPSPSPTLP